MMPLALLLAAALSQEPEPAATAPAERPALEVLSAPSPATELAPPAELPSAPASPPAPAPPAKPKGADEVLKQLGRLKDLPEEERRVLLEQLRKQWGAAEVSPILPPPDLDLERFTALPSVDQAKVTVRHFFGDVMASNTSGMLAHCGLPFFLEDRRIDRADELRTEWARHLKSKRTDLLALYDVSVLTPVEMEKQHGPPPRRLSGWSWRAPNTLLAVANLSGHAVVLLLKPVGAAWQIVGFHD